MVGLRQSRRRKTALAKLRRFLRRLPRRFRTRALILAYHRVAAVPWDPAGLCVSPEHFAEHLAVLCERFAPMSLAELLADLERGTLRRRSVVVTFDDGYADNLLQAKPMLGRFGVPATVFVTTAPLDEERELWWDELERALEHAPLPPRRLPGASPAWELPEAAAPASADRLQLFHAWRDWLMQRSHEERRKALDALLAAAGCGVAPRPSHRTLTEEEIAELAADGAIEVGAHTVTHPMLSLLPPSERRSEMLASKRRLEALLDRPVRSFAHPFGEPQHFASTAGALLRECGFACACSSVPRPVDADADRFWLPRTTVGDWDGDRFTRRLAGWLRD
jgi:peptidoglycan/xylan/chitin deacetylase (PgdA/CDA1 family)